MNDVLWPYLDSFVLVYLDDTLVYSSTWEEHMSHIMQVLETVKRNQLLVNLKKCEFLSNHWSIWYVISEGELKIDLAKIKAIKKWPIPTNVAKVRIFVGETQYLKQFVVSFSVVVASLHTIKNNDESFQWGKNQYKSFDEIKQNIIWEPVLELPNL